MPDLLTEAVPALEWLGLKPVRSFGFLVLSFNHPTSGVSAIAEIDPGALRDLAFLAEIVLNALEAKGYVPSLNLAEGFDEGGKYECILDTAAGTDDSRSLGYGHTRTEAVLKAAIAAHKEATNG